MLQLNTVILTDMENEIKKLQPDISNIIYRGLAKFVPDHKINLVDDVATDLVDYISERLVKNNGVLDGVIKRFEVGKEVIWKDKPFYVVEEKDAAILVSNGLELDDELYCDWWVNMSDVNILLMTTD